MQRILCYLALFLLAFAAAVVWQKSFSGPADRSAQSDPLVQFGVQYTVHSKILNEDRVYSVYLPPSYQTKANRRHQEYPVLYVLDGDWNFSWAAEVVRFMETAAC